MNWFLLKDGVVVRAVSNKEFWAENRGVRDKIKFARVFDALGSRLVDGWCNRNDIDSFGLAEQIAAGCSALGDKYIASDSGSSCSPRYDVIKCPALGDDCSMGFNGDYYPVGKIVAISASLRVISVEGPRGKLKFYRRRLSGSWLNRPFALIPGVFDERNPSF